MHMGEWTLFIEEGFQNEDVEEEKALVLIFLAQVASWQHMRPFTSQHQTRK
jgi:hypothetical protein